MNVKEDTDAVVSIGNRSKALVSDSSADIFVSISSVRNEYARLMSAVIYA